MDKATYDRHAANHAALVAAKDAMAEQWAREDEGTRVARAAWLEQHAQGVRDSEALTAEHDRALAEKLKADEDEALEHLVAVQKARAAAAAKVAPAAEPVVPEAEAVAPVA